MRRAWATAAVVAATGAMLVFAGAASAHHAGEPELLVMSDSVAGGPMTVTGSYLAEKIEYSLRLRSDAGAEVPLGTVATDETGAFALTTPAIPADFPLGPARVVALDPGGTAVAVELIVAAPVGVAPREAPGRRPDLGAPIAGVLLALAVVFAVRWRRS